MYNNFKRRDTVICDRIRALREKTGMSARKFAEEMGMKYTTYYGYETGSREPGSDSEGRGFESLRAGQKIPHEIAVFRLLRAVFVLLEILQNALKYRNISQKCKSTCKSISNLVSKNILYKFRFLLDFI